MVKKNYQYKSMLIDLPWVISFNCGGIIEMPGFVSIIEEVL